ncbi:hypothetical protein BN1723_012161 [Verticillium longisporum]|uniref:Tryptophan synthase beta chain-like PALP domain-containing protein n=1 Tax=Verticillium longisporum TaxID=100787 RepID=A0A0G4LGN6_VERLO|nr:hypothetical protein BN1723_012161 [Verticillium longisporum]
MGYAMPDLNKYTTVLPTDIPSPVATVGEYQQASLHSRLGTGGARRGETNLTGSSAGLDYPGVGPELSSWKDSNRAQYVVATDAQAFIGFRLMSQLEGIIPALESAHGIYGALELAKTMKKDEDVVICLSGRGDKDVQSVADELPTLGPKIGWDLRF